MLRLLVGDFHDGWQELEWRWKTEQQRPKNFTQPLWQGEQLHGRTILLHAEQGFGDTIQFIRYASLVKRLGATVVRRMSPPLLPLLASYRGIDQLVGQGNDFPPFDVHGPLLSLPRIFATNVETIPATVPYLLLTELWLHCGGTS